MKRELNQKAKTKLLTAINGRLESCADIEELAEEYPELTEAELLYVQAEIWKQISRIAKFIRK